MNKYAEEDNVYLLVEFEAPGELEEWFEAVTGLEIDIKWWAEETQPRISNKTVSFNKIYRSWFKLKIYFKIKSKIKNIK